jgi:hypothetical protein
MDQDSVRSPRTVSESEAQRLLARASELDAHLGGVVSLDRLRQAAREAGLSNAAFDVALAELRATPSSTSASATKAWPRLARVAGPVLGAAALLIGGALILNDSNAAWLVRKLLDPLALGVGAALAFRFRVRPLAIVLGGLAVATGAEFLMDFWAGQPAIRGAEPHFALLIAGIGGVLLGALWSRKPRDGAPSAGTAPESVQKPDDVRSKDVELIVSAA